MRRDETRPDPPDPEIAPLIDALLAGDPAPLVEVLRHLGDWSIYDGERLWWELSTLYGEVIGAMEIAQASRHIPTMLAFRHPRLTGGAPRTIADPTALAATWRAALAVPPTREGHRRAMARTLAALRADRHPQPDAAFALLRHHTDLPVDFFDGRPLVGVMGGVPVAAIAAELDALAPAFATAAAFAQQVGDGLASPSLPRRDLCWRLAGLGG